MGGYIGAKVGTLVATAADISGDITATDSTPELILKNTSEEDTEGGREGKITFKGEQSGGEESTLAQIESAHDGTSDDQKGDLIFKTNDGSDGASPTERMRIDSQGDVGIGRTDPITKLHLMHNTSGEDVVLRIQNANASSGAEATLNLTASGNNFSIINYPDADTGNANRTTFKSTAGSSFFTFETAGSEAMRIDSDGNVGIASTSVTSLGTGITTLELKGNSASQTDRAGGIRFERHDGTYAGAIYNADGAFYHDAGAYPMLFFTNSAERMRIDSSGNFLVGQSTSVAPASGNVVGNAISPLGYISTSRDGGVSAEFGRKTSDGDIVVFRKDGTTVGKIACYGGDIQIGTGNNNLYFNDGALSMEPRNADGTRRDNAIDMGHTSARFDDIRATNGTIQTSDEREKQQIASLTDAEMTAAKAISKLFKTFKWNDKVEEKGDAARTHTGVIAQQVETAMSDAGLDAGNYAFFISDTWWETQTEVAAIEADEDNGIEAQEAYTRTDTYDTQEEAPEGATERNRKGIRYPELLSFIGAATEQRLTSIEARLDALEGE
jgi:hypothetical protein